MPLDTILERRLLIVSGKGGVGKTTISVTLAILAARLGKNVLIAEVEGKQAIGQFFGADELTDAPVELLPNLSAMRISATKSLEEYFEVQFHMKRIAKPLISSQLVYYVTQAAPGLRDILMLGKVWHEATKKKKFDLIILDTPASGHAVSMLRSPDGFLDAVPIGPLANHARQVSEWLRDPNEVSINLVSMPEEMPVAETIETTALLEERLEMDVANVFVNMKYPQMFASDNLTKKWAEVKSSREVVALAKKDDITLKKSEAEALFVCGSFYRERQLLQNHHMRELSDALSGTSSIVELPYLFADSFGIDELTTLADVIEKSLA